MPRRPEVSNRNPITMYGALDEETRDQLNRLAEVQTERGTQAELVTRILAQFISARPYEKPGFEWKTPRGYWVFTDGVRSRRPGWWAWNPQVVDTEDANGVTIKSDSIVAAIREISALRIKALTDADVPVSGRDKGVQSTLYTAMLWGLQQYTIPPKKASAASKTAVTFEASSVVGAVKKTTIATVKRTEKAKSQVLSLSISAEQMAKLVKLAKAADMPKAADWVRMAIDKARLPE